MVGYASDEHSRYRITIEGASIPKLSAEILYCTIMRIISMMEPCFVDAPALNLSVA